MKSYFQLIKWNLYFEKTFFWDFHVLTKTKKRLTKYYVEKYLQLCYSVFHWGISYIKCCPCSAWKLLSGSFKDFLYSLYIIEILPKIT